MLICQQRTIRMKSRTIKLHNDEVQDAILQQ